MKRVDTIARERRAFYVQGWSMKKIVRELHVSRNTVRKILRTDETDFSYERERQPMPRIGPWQGQLEQFLSSNANKPARERLTLIRIFEELRGFGYQGGYDAVHRFARNWSQNRGAVTAEAYVPLYYAPGEAYQFDWSHEIVLISGVTVTIKVAHASDGRIWRVMDIDHNPPEPICWCEPQDGTTGSSWVMLASLTAITSAAHVAEAEMIAEVLAEMAADPPELE